MEPSVYPYLGRSRPVKTRKATAEDIRQAEIEGYIEGVRNWHRSRQEYGGGPEWPSWLKGWRRGQKDFKRVMGGL